MRTEDLGRYQMLWDCPACGTEKLLGLDHRHCPSCGHPQDADKRYYPPEGEEIAVADHPYHGADRVCPACNTPTAAISHFCGSCGSPLDEAAAARKKADDRPVEPPPAPPPPPPKSGGMGKLALGCVGLLMVALVGLCLVATFWKKEATATVAGHTWERSIEVEKESTVRESAWKEDLPSGARNARCSREQKGTEQVADGEECTVVRKDKGDGTYDKVNECKTKYRDEPVYAEKCSYEIDKWVTARTERAQGTSTSDKVGWPSVRLAAGEREGSRKESYVVTFTLEGGETETCDTTQQRWASLQPGSRWKAEVGVLAGGIDCDELQAL